MKKFFTALLILISIYNTDAQSPNWGWAKSGGGAGNEYNWGIAVDASGNSVVAGHFFSTSLSLGSATLTNLGDRDCFVVKYDPSGNVLWANRIGGLYDDGVFDVALDASGNSYVTGYFSGIITVGSTTLTSAGNYDVFLIKYDPSGIVVWAKSVGGTGQEMGWCVAVDGAGNSYLTGEFASSAMTAGSTTLSSAGDFDIFILKFDATGSVLWAKGIGGSLEDRGRSISVDGAGNIYTTGWFKSNALSFGSTTITNSGDFDMFIVKYSSSGAVLWARKEGGSGFEYGRSIVADVSGNIYITGPFNSTFSYGATTLTNAGSLDIFVSKHDPSGNNLWVKSIGGADADETYDIALDAAGNTYITGQFQSNNMLVGSTTLANAGGYDVLVAKYDPAGNAEWAKSTGGAADDRCYGISVDGSGSSYIAGFFGSTNIGFGSTLLNNAGGSDFFAARLGSCSIAPVQPGLITGVGTPCESSTETYSVGSVSGAVTYSWTLPAGWLGTSTTNSITTTVGTLGGNITVEAVNACGVSPLRTLAITSVLSLPSPTITQSGNTLSVTTSFSSYQWYLNGTAISGATSQSHIASQNGNYHVVVTGSNNCSGQSNTLGIILDVTEVNLKTGLSLYPNPVQTMLYLNHDKAVGMINVYNSLGRKVHEVYIEQNHAEINLAHLPAGAYVLRTEERAMKIIKE
jgi:hypothetical protein